MDQHTSHELAYQNGYSEGHEKGYKEGFLRGFDAGKQDAVIEFVERLKEYKYLSSDWSHGEHPFVVEENDIDQLLFETLEACKKIWDNSKT